MSLISVYNILCLDKFGNGVNEVKGDLNLSCTSKRTTYVLTLQNIRENNMLIYKSWDPQGNKNIAFSITKERNCPSTIFGKLSIQYKIT